MIGTCLLLTGVGSVCRLGLHAVWGRQLWVSLAPSQTLLLAVIWDEAKRPLASPCCFRRSGIRRTGP